jgi:enediyne biosynthesis protein E4
MRRERVKSSWVPILVLLPVLLVRLPSDSMAKSPLPVFTDVTEKAGITAKHSYGDHDLSNIVEGTGSGCMFFDYDNDGDLDIYLPNGCWLKEVNDNRGRNLRGKLHNTLYRNNGDGTFSDVTEKAGVGDRGYGVGCSAADYDGDGDLDLYVLNYGPNVFYQNNGNGTFTDITQKARLGGNHWSLSSPWFDYDNDGDLDVYVANYLEYDQGAFRSYYAAAGYPGPLSYNGQQDILYRNNGDGTFTNVSEKAGLKNPNGRAMSAAVADLDNDGRLDIYITNDGMENYFYRNSGKGTFINHALTMGLAFGEGGQGVSSMGPAIGDVDRNGWLDIYIPDMGYGCLMMNQKDYFEDRTAPTNLTLICGQYTGWGGLLFDYDCDGLLDIFIANGNAHHEYTEEDVLVWNNGQGKFIDVAKHSGPYFHDKYVGRGSTFGDYDNDGDPDLLIVNLNGVPRLLRNDGGNRNHWLMIAAKLANGKTDAVGARITVRAAGRTMIHDLIPVTGYLSQADPRAHFGLGTSKQAESIEIRWPDRTTTKRKNVKAGQLLTIVQKKR